LAKPYPARTFTLQEVPSLAWRTDSRAGVLGAFFCASVAGKVFLLENDDNFPWFLVGILGLIFLIY